MAVFARIILCKYRFTSITYHRFLMYGQAFAEYLKNRGSTAEAGFVKTREPAFWKSRAVVLRKPS
jgi:hypothetical protein